MFTLADFEIHQEKDSPNHDVLCCYNKDVQVLLNIFNGCYNSICFNTEGFLKDIIIKDLSGFSGDLYTLKKKNLKFKKVLFYDVPEIPNIIDNRSQFIAEMEIKSINDLAEDMKTSDCDYYIVIKNNTFLIDNFNYYLEYLLYLISYRNYDFLSLGNTNETIIKSDKPTILKCNTNINSDDMIGYIIRKDVHFSSIGPYLYTHPPLMYDKRNIDAPQYKNFLFYPGKDSPGNDISGRIEVKDIESSKDIIYVNTYGYQKYHLKPITHWINLKPKKYKIEGIYLKKSPLADLTDNEFKHNYQIQIINLERRIDRRDKMILEMEKAEIKNYNFFKAVDGNTLESSDQLIEMFNGNNFDFRTGIMGCALSHIRLYEQLLSSKYDIYLILEDDVTLCQNFRVQLEQCVNYGKIGM